MMFHQHLLAFARAWEVYRKVLNSAGSNRRLFLPSCCVVVGQTFLQPNNMHAICIHLWGWIITKSSYFVEECIFPHYSVWYLVLDIAVQLHTVSEMGREALQETSQPIHTRAALICIQVPVSPKGWRAWLTPIPFFCSFLEMGVKDQMGAATVGL